MQTARAATSETSSAVGASSAPGKTCHLRLGHLYDIVEVLALPQPRAPPELTSPLQVTHRSRVGWVPIHRDLARVHGMWLPQDLSEEALGRRRIPPGREQDVDRLAEAVHRAIQIRTHALDPD